MEDADKLDNYLVSDLIRQEIFQRSFLRLHPEKEPGGYPPGQEPVPIEQQARWLCR